MAVPKISVEDVSKAFPVRGGGAVTALDAISLDVSAGEFLVVVGPSGCGKSTLLDLLGGLTRPSSGRILLDGKQVTGPALDRGIVFQQYALFPWRTAQRNVEFGLEAKGVPRRERAEIARGHLELVGLSGFEDRYPHELSGGMKQRVAIARSLAYEPDVLLMDEPFAALDAQTRDSLQEELLRIWERTGKTLVFITHSIDEAVYLGTRVAVLTTRPGRIKDVVDIDLGSRHDVDDLRSTPEFAAHRHHLWTLLHNDTQDSTHISTSNGRAGGGVHGGLRGGTGEGAQVVVRGGDYGDGRGGEADAAGAGVDGAREAVRVGDFDVARDDRAEGRNDNASEDMSEGAVDRTAGASSGASEGRRDGDASEGRRDGGAAGGGRDGTASGTRGGGQDGTREVAGV